MRKYNDFNTFRESGKNSLNDSLNLEYSIPKINSYNFDMTKDWYVWFTAISPTGEKKLFVYKRGVNYFKVKRERVKEINALRLAIENALHEGFNPFTKKETFQETHLQRSLENILAVKKSSLRLKSYRTYNDILNMFTGWLNENGLSKLSARKFSKVDAMRYADYLLKDRKFSGKSYNHNIGILKTFFNALISREIISVNPFKGIKELPEDSGSNIPYTEAEKIRIIDYLKRYNERLYFAVSFVYYCFIRRSELIQLCVRDVNMDSHTITIPGYVSKNRKQESVTIPMEFEKVLRKMKLQDHDPDEFIFGHKFETCSRKIIRADSLSTAMTRINTEMKIIGKSFYTWKHSGVVALYLATKDPYLVMKQCRHSDLKITLIYLRSMGLAVDEGIRRSNFKM